MAKPNRPVQIEYIALADIRTAQAQNPARTSARSLERLLEEIREAGCILVPIHVVRGGTGIFIIADGHRRVACARELKWAKVPAVIHERGSVAALWAALNGATRPTGPGDWLYGWARLHTTPREQAQWAEHMPPKTMALIRHMVKLIGEQRTVEIGEQRLASPSVSTHTHMIHAAVASKLGGSPVSKREILEWLIAHGSTAKLYFNGSVTVKGCRKFCSRVKSNLPWPRGEWQ